MGFEGGRDHEGFDANKIEELKIDGGTSSRHRRIGARALRIKDGVSSGEKRL